MILVSACLLGVNCRYDGKNNYNSELASRIAQGHLLPICPEQLGGLPTPRIPAEIIGGNANDLLDAYPFILEDDDNNIKLNIADNLSLEDLAADNLDPISVRVVNEAGKDLTANFLIGACEVSRLAKRAGVRAAILKARSPSCGCGQIYNGAFSNCMVNGDGITAALLQKQGIKVYTEEEITPEFLDHLLADS